MRAKEFIQITPQVDEGWKKWAAAGALGTLAGLNYPQGTDKIDPTPAPIVKRVEKLPTQPTYQTPQRQNTEPKEVTGSPHERLLKQTAIAAGIKGTELSAFLSQCAHETLNFTRMIERGGKLDFKKYDPKFAPAKAKSLGNVKPGDGQLYKGRGYIQLTGRYNYKKAGDALGLPLEQKPSLLEKPEIAAKVAVWFWQHRVRPNVSDFSDVLAVTKKINPSLHGLQSRQTSFQKFLPENISINL